MVLHVDESNAMTTKPLTQYHLGTLYLIQMRGPQPLRKAEIARLITMGLIAPTGPRGQYGMTYYALTPKGKTVAQTIQLVTTAAGKAGYVTG